MASLSRGADSGAGMEPPPSFEDAFAELPASLEGVPERTLATYREAFASFAHGGYILRPGTDGLYTMCAPPLTCISDGCTVSSCRFGALF